MNSCTKAFWTIAGSTIFVIFYIIKIVFPFLESYAPENESTLIWAYHTAPLHFALIFYPVVILYGIAITKNVLKIKYIRWLLYPICFCLLFVLAHMCFFIFSMVILWCCLITIPVGIFLLITLEIFALTFDIKDYRNKDSVETKKNDNLQTVLNIFGYMIIPSSLIFLVFVSLISIVTEPKIDNTQCKNFYNAIKLSNASVDNINSLSFDKIAEYYQKDFSNTKKYEEFFGSYKNKYKKGNFIESTIQKDGRAKDTTVNWVQFNLYEQGNEKYSFSFEKKGLCMNNSENCMWYLHNKKPTCAFSVDENGTITPTKRTAIFIE